MLVYHDGFWGVPRWDHLVFLYEASWLHTPWDLVRHAPAWTRSLGLGDHIEYRPLFHLLLVGEQLLFGRAYTLWQSLGIAAHALQAVLLLRLGRRAFPGSIWPPLLLAALFATLLLPAETVVWMQTTAYILCAACLTASLERLLAYLESGRRGAAAAATLLALVAAFTYELGPFTCAVVGSLLVASGLGASRRRGAPPAGAVVSSGRARLIMGAAYGLVAAVYVVVSSVDLLLRFPRLEGADLPPSQHGALALGAVYAVQQIGFWLGGMAFPSLYDIVPGARARFVGFVSPSGPIAAANVGAVTLVLSGMLAVLVGLRRPLGRSAPGVLAGLVFCAAYSLLVAFGRSVARGLDYTLGQNLQHAYPALLAVIVTVMLGAWSWSRSGEARIAVVRSYRSGLVLLGLGGITLAAVNSLGTMAFLAELRHSYVAPKHELLHHVGLWHARAVRPPYFRIAPDCPGNDPLPWFDVYLRRNASGVSFADVLFPDTSFDLHRSRLGATALVDEISCADGAVAPEAVTGEWREASRSASVLARPDGRLEAIGPSGARSALMLEDHRVSAPAWRAEGILSHDAGYIFWRGAIPWRR